MWQRAKRASKKSSATLVIRLDSGEPKEIVLEILKKEGFSTENIAFGMGGGLLQAVGRDDFRFAMKASAICVDGEWRDVYKDPITDSGKRSKRGRLALSCDFETVRVEELEGREDLLKPIFKNGKLLKDYSFDEVRNA